jgi:protocatechuate 3,4-dioxygenase beta subunit
MKSLIALAIALATATPQQQRDPVRDLRNPAPPPAGTSTIRGMVVADASGGAIRLANVVAIGALTGTLRVTSTDAEGRFAFATLPADRYLVAASKLPYLGAIAGARRPARPGTPVVVANGQTVEGVSIRLPMGAAISGTITDERGQPGTSVQLSLHQWRNQGGERTLVGARTPTASVDDRGRYRFYGLPPGEYVVVAISNASTRIGRPLSSADVDAALKGAPVSVEPLSPMQVAQFYYPGTPRAAESVPVVVNAGEERQGVDFRLEFVRPGRVEGSVATTDGSPTTGVTVEIGPVPPAAATFRTMIGIGPDGNFGVAGLPPGSYLFVARGRGPTAGQFAAATSEISGLDVARIALTMKPGLTLTGRLVFDGAPAPSVANRRVPAQALTSSPGGVTSTVTDAAGVFTIPSVLPGRYLIGGPLYFGPTTTDSVTWTLQSVVADGRDITDLPLDIIDTAPKEIVVTYGDRFQELSGRLITASGAPVSDFTVIAFPTSKAYWIATSRRIVTARPGTNGEFVLSGPGLATLPAGDYLIAAITDIDRNEQYDPAFLATLVTSAVPVTLKPGAKTVQNLQIR